MSAMRCRAAPRIYDVGTRTRAKVRDDDGERANAAHYIIFHDAWFSSACLIFTPIHFDGKRCGVQREAARRARHKEVRQAEVAAKEVRVQAA